MKLTLNGIRNDRAAYQAAGYELPAFDYETVRKNTLNRPMWIHFGAGNIFRAFPARMVQELLNKDIMKTGLIAAEGYDYEVAEKGLRPHDNLTVLATLKSNNTVEKTVVGSIMESLLLDSSKEKEFSRLREIFAAPSLQMASFTITEKGYATTDAKGKVLPLVEADYKKGPDHPDSYLGKVASLLYTRYENGKLPLAMVSMDNCSHNGDRLYHAINSFAQAWCGAGLTAPGFADYINDPQFVTFPWTMIDKITPRPDRQIEALLKEDGLEDTGALITSKNSYIAPFVNAEECEYLVIEDLFPGGRPPLEKGGIIFTDRDTVEKVEKMKVCTCLNPIHTALAIYGCLLGYEKIASEMQSPLLRQLAELLGFQEGLPVVTHPGILEPERFLKEVLEVRLPNPFLPDTPQRIATDTSQKLAIRFGETIKSYHRSKTLKVSDLKIIPLVFAGWLRYLMGVDDQGKSFPLSPDPLLDTITAYVADFSLTEEPKKLHRLDPLLSNPQIFGVNLEEVGMAELVKKYFAELSQGIGAVEATLKKYVK